MKENRFTIYGINPKGFLYVRDNNYNTIICLQVNHSPSELENNFSSLPVFNTIEEAQKQLVFSIKREKAIYENLMLNE